MLVLYCSIRVCKIAFTRKTLLGAELGKNHPHCAQPIHHLPLVLRFFAVRTHV